MDPKELRVLLAHKVLHLKVQLVPKEHLLKVLLVLQEKANPKELPPVFQLLVMIVPLITLHFQ
jgi:hypothetical protein